MAQRSHVAHESGCDVFNCGVIFIERAEYFFDPLLVLLSLFQMEPESLRDYAFSGGAAWR